MGHNLGHRWWHDEMKKGSQTFYSYGEREHHRIYDGHGQFAFQHNEDPHELFMSFPFTIVAAIGLIFVALYGWLLGWPHSMGFAAGLYFFMLLDHRLHLLFHRTPQLGGILGRFQTMHLIHHATHRNNFFFVSGILWDMLFRTFETTLPAHVLREVNVAGPEIAEPRLP